MRPAPSEGGPRNLRFDSDRNVCILAVMSDFNIDYVAQLARIDLSPAEKAQLGPQLAAILGYVAKLKEINVEGVEPTAHAFPLVNITRPDEITASLSNEEALSNAPAKAGGLFMVPKIVE